MPKLIVRTYEIVTPESAENGDTAENGWADYQGNKFPVQDAAGYHREHVDIDRELIGHECEPDCFDVAEGLSAVDVAARFLYRQGVAEASDSSYRPGVWYIGEREQDYRTGAETTYSYHLEGFTEDEERAVFAGMVPRRRAA